MAQLDNTSTLPPASTRSTSSNEEHHQPHSINTLASLPPPSTSLQPLSHDAFETGALESARVELWSMEPDSDLSELENSDSEEGERSDNDETRASTSDSSVMGTPEEEFKQTHVPNMPVLGDSFTSSDALATSLRSAMLPVLGIGVSVVRTRSNEYKMKCNRNMPSRFGDNSCSFVVCAGYDASTKLWRINDSSELSHNHGPNPRILDDPDWRPTNRAAANMERKRRESRKRRQSSSEVEEACEDDSPRPESAPPATSVLSTSSRRIKRPASFSPSAPSEPSVPPPRRKYPLRSLSTFGQASRAFSTSSTSAMAPPSISTRPSLSRSPVPSTVPLQITSSDIPVDSNLFQPQLATFLTALHSSFAPLADSLSTKGGIISLETLVSVLSMTEGSRRNLLQSVGLTTMQRVLLQSKLRLLDGRSRRLQSADKQGEPMDTS